jgi:hypothetical protein
MPKASKNTRGLSLMYALTKYWCYALNSPDHRLRQYPIWSSAFRRSDQHHQRATSGWSKGPIKISCALSIRESYCNFFNSSSLAWTIDWDWWWDCWRTNLTSMELRGVEEGTQCCLHTSFWWVHWYLPVQFHMIIFLQERPAPRKHQIIRAITLISLTLGALACQLVLIFINEKWVKAISMGISIPLVLLISTLWSTPFAPGKPFYVLTKLWQKFFYYTKST